jgi:AraC-like DNA-binding protein
LRVRRAESLLRNTPMTLKEIAERLGYSSPFHLSKEFKKQTGIAPDAWRRKRVR